ncbi:MAG TPA: hypothetical protein VK638_33760 [Edaphobacter sp.]|nr:hypothetical protein [Edaphobacter sp.]
MLDEDGEITEEGRFRTTEGGVAKRFEDMDRVRVAMETGAHSIWISEQLQEYGHEVIVVNVTELHAIVVTTARETRRMQRSWYGMPDSIRVSTDALVPEDAVPIQHLHDLAFRVSLRDEQIVNVPDSLNFSFRSRNQDDPVGLQALSFAQAQQALRIPITVDQLPSQTVSRLPSLAESQFDEAALTQLEDAFPFAYRLTSRSNRVG